MPAVGAEDERRFDELVLDTVAVLANHTRSPSKSLILSQICAPRSVAARSMQHAVLSSLERLHVQGLISYVPHRGTRHWQVTRTPVRPGPGSDPP